MKIAIRADGGNEIGMGHIMRTLVLAKELSKTNEVFYICRIDNPITKKYKAGINKVKDSGFQIKLINENCVIEDLKDINADLLITDSYDVDKLYFDETKKMFRITGYIDDVKELDYYNVDFIINQNIYAKDFIYKTNANTQLFLGSKYILLRDEFRKIKANNLNRYVRNILITVGASDINNITYKLLNCLKNLNYYFHVIVGSGFNKINNLIDLEKQNDNIKLYFNANMSDIMQKCDVAISACGSTLYELAICKVPTLGIVVADNQIRIANTMQKIEMIINLGYYNKLTSKELMNCFNGLCNDFKLRMKLIKNGDRINKDGVITLVKNINNLNNIYKVR